MTTTTVPAPPLPAALAAALRARREGKASGRESEPLRRLADAIAGVKGSRS